MSTIWKELSENESVLVAKIGKAEAPKLGWRTKIEWLNCSPITGQVLNKKRRFIIARPI